jgi:uncharacterized membrane protein
MKRNRTLFLCQAALIAALYVVLTYVARLFGLDSGVIQLRISEALCILPIFLPAAIPGLYVGCLISNILMGAIWMDVLIGPIATLIGALGTYALRRHVWLAPLPPVLANTLLIPPVLAFGYGATQSIPFLMITVGIGEILSVYVCGLLLYAALRKRNIRW